MNELADDVRTVVSRASVDPFVSAHLPPPQDWPQFLALPSLPVNANVTLGLLDAHVGKGCDGRSALLQASANGLLAWSYGELFEQVQRIAAVLVDQLGVRPGNRVLLRSPNNRMLVACWLAVVRVGAVAVTTMPLLRSAELCGIVQKAQIQFALCDARFAHELHRCQWTLESVPDAVEQGLLAQVLYFNTDDAQGLEHLMRYTAAQVPAYAASASDPALIAFTSGTTGSPKGTVHFHRDVWAINQCFPKHALQMTDQDRCCGTPPLGFTFGLGGLLCFPLAFGACAVLAEKLSPQAMLSLVDLSAATLMFTAPTFYRQMTPHAHAHRLRSLRLCVSAGEALPQATRAAWQQASGVPMIDGLGSTEMLHVFIASAAQDTRDHAVGKALPGYEVAVLDEHLCAVPHGTIGHLAVKGPTGCRYLHDERQRTYVRGGWNFTGDIGSLDADGYFYYRARNDNMIISAGYSISGPEVEAALLAHEAVAECAVVGLPDHERGELVSAHVVLNADYTASAELGTALQNFVKEQIAPYKYPRRILFCAQLPRTETGKLQHFKLRQEA